MILLDTHIFVWYAAASRSLGRRAIAAIDRALRRSELSVSAISFWEIAMLAEKNRLKLNATPQALRARALQEGISEYSINGEIAIRSAELYALHADPADRFIASTAIWTGATLLTCDERLLSASLPGLRCQDGCL